MGEVQAQDWGTVFLKVCALLEDPPAHPCLRAREVCESVGGYCETVGIGSDPGLCIRFVSASLSCCTELRRAKTSDAVGSTEVVQHPSAHQVPSPPIWQGRMPS